MKPKKVVKTKKMVKEPTRARSSRKRPMATKEIRPAPSRKRERSKSPKSQRAVEQQRQASVHPASAIPQLGSVSPLREVSGGIRGPVAVAYKRERHGIQGIPKRRRAEPRVRE